MQITVTTRHIDSRDRAESLREYVEKRAKRRIERYIKSMRDPSEVKVILSVEKFRNNVEILVNSGALKVTTSVEREEMYAAIDTAMDSVVKQLKRQTDKKIKVRRRGGVKSKEEFAAETEAEPSAAVHDGGDDVSVEKVPPRPMSVEEAVLQLTVSDKDFIVFHDSETGKVNVVYKRKGGKAGLIMP